jgi:hypothetical protein
MKTNDPVFWEELTKGKALDLPKPNETPPEDKDLDTSLEDIDVDDSDVTISTLIGVMTGGELPDHVGIREGGGLASIAEAENVDESAEANHSTNTDKPDSEENKPKEEGRGKRSKISNKLYSAFWRHNDGDDWRDDRLLPSDEMSP